MKASADLIVSYHPPLFRPFKRLSSKSWKERIAVKCIEERIAVFSPHTSWDAVPGGINTWLLAPFGPGDSAPVSPASSKVWPGGVSHSVSVQGVPISTEQLTSLLALPDISVSLDTAALSVGCSKVILGKHIILSAMIFSEPAFICDIQLASGSSASYENNRAQQASAGGHGLRPSAEA